MHGIQVLRTLIAALFLTVTFQAPAVQATASVYEQFNKETATLKNDLKKEKSTSARYDLIQKSLEKQKALRAKGPRQSEEQELNMSFYMDTLSYLPKSKKDFEAKKCDEHKKTVRNMMKQYTEQEKEPFIEQAFEVVDLLCGSKK